YENFNLYCTGEGFHYVKFSLIDATFDPSQPEMLLYSPVPGEDRLELAGVEYLVPLSASPDAPSGFTGDADQWRMDSEGFGLWELNAWIWLHYPEGVFGHDIPRVLRCVRRWLVRTLANGPSTETRRLEAPKEISQ